jgi:dipeptide/tripeptide permease
MSFEPERYEDPSARAAERTNLPGIFLIVVGALNILFALYLVVNGIVVMTNPENVLRTMTGLGFAPKDQVTAGQMKGYGVFYIGWGIVSLIGCFLTILAGVKMRWLQSYALAMTGAIVAALPGISCLGCCGVGEAIGIWAVVVLLSADVKAAFESHPGDLPPPGPVAY